MAGDDECTRDTDINIWIGVDATHPEQVKLSFGVPVPAVRFTPDQARTIAEALKTAADVAESSTATRQ